MANDMARMGFNERSESTVDDDLMGLDAKIPGGIFDSQHVPSGADVDMVKK